MTNEEVLEAAKRYTDQMFRVFVFEHGTVIVSNKLEYATEAAACDLLRHFAVPGGGAGSSFGDIVSVKMKDGNTLYEWLPPFAIFSLVSNEELQKQISTRGPTWKISTRGPTWKISTRGPTWKISCATGAEDLAVLRHGLHARKCRGLDAKTPRVVLQFHPDKAGV